MPPLAPEHTHRDCAPPRLAGGDIQEITRRLARIEQVFEIEELGERGLRESEIARYYERSAIGYRLVHSAEGAMHMALNPDGRFDKDGYYGPAREVQRRISPHTTAVLELAVGKGFNTAYLADRNPQIAFSGVDITAAHLRAACRRTAHLSNTSLRLGNFQELEFASASFEVVFVVESLCHAIDMPRALAEAHRVLRPGGHLIVIDGWRSERFSELAPAARRAAELSERAMSVGKPWSFGHWVSQTRASEFELVENVDLTSSIMPNLRRLERIAARYFRHLALARLSRRLAPLELLSNAIAGYLMALTCEAGAHTYRLVSLRRR